MKHKEFASRTLFSTQVDLPVIATGTGRECWPFGRIEPAVFAGVGQRDGSQVGGRLLVARQRQSNCPRLRSLAGAHWNLLDNGLLRLHHSYPTRKALLVSSG